MNKYTILSLSQHLTDFTRLYCQTFLLFPIRKFLPWFKNRILDGHWLEMKYPSGNYPVWRIGLDWYSVLFRACKIRNLDLAFLAFDVFRPPDKKTYRNNSFYNYGLWGACQGGHLDIAKWMLRLGATDIAHTSEKCHLGGHPEMIEKLLAFYKQERDPNLFFMTANSQAKFYKEM